ncbi:MAG: CDGSH iron-sulfur domain-containing protein [Burkholderiales bacterium]|nr:CDGSH iron-sulfur domain-containing protein [Burkholderiales bacterium]
MNRVVVTADGPYCCTGSLELRSADGQVLATPAETRLCRCGLSRDKPWCDGSHTLAGLAREILHADTVEQSSAAGLLRIRTRRDGPLKLDGPCEVRAEDGTILMRGNETALCRCGRSGRKPFCDGTHRHTGFAAP